VSDLEASAFWKRVERRGLGECWPWMGALALGYGRLCIGGKQRWAHRLAYELLVGPIPEDKQIDHLCRNRRCVNPGHMEVVTQRENLLRGMGPSAMAARQTHCIHGHPLFGENARVVNGRRRCRACERARDAGRAR
jgi:hypothetical protein